MHDARWLKVILVSALAVLAPACDEPLSDLAGPTPNLTPSFTSIQREIFDRTDASGRLACTQCHTAGGLAAGTGLILTAGVSYGNLVGRPSRLHAGGVLVIPGDADNSYLVRKLEGGPDITGLRMPGTSGRSSPPGRWRSCVAGSPTVRPTTDRRRQPARRGMSMTSAISTTIVAAALVAFAATASAQPVDGPAESAPSGEAAVAQDEDPDRDVNRAQPDFTLIGLPTTLRLPARASAFRITHRFGRPLGQGSFGELLEDFFGFDSGAQIGFEYRYGLFRATQLAVHRTSNRTIQFLLQRQVKAQSGDFPLSFDAIAVAEGTNNFKDSYSPALGLLVSREFTDRGAIYAEPIWVNNTNPLPGEVADDNSTFMIGLGARLRLTGTLYGVFELTPRLAGHDPGDHQIGFGIEKRAGGHSFQVNAGNAFGTTFAQMARGGGDEWFIGFNISRKFY